MYWTEIHGGQSLSGPKLTKSCSVYKEEEVWEIVHEYFVVMTSRIEMGCVQRYCIVN
jgi:hypothetical protein